MLDALDQIYQCGGKPERSNSFPLSSIIGQEVLLWQEFKWSPKVCAWEDLLQIFNGEKLGIRMPGQSPIQHRNMAPMFYTAWAPLTMRCENVEEMANLNMAMSERFTTRHWVHPLPREGRLPVFPHCGKCFASFVLSNAAPPSGQSVAPSM